MADISLRLFRNVPCGYKKLLAAVNMIFPLYVCFAVDNTVVNQRDLLRSVPPTLVAAHRGHIGELEVSGLAEHLRQAERITAVYFIFYCNTRTDIHTNINMMYAKRTIGSGIQGANRYDDVWLQ